MNENVQAEPQSELFESYQEYTDASQGSRFINYLVDNLFMQFVLSYGSGYVVGYLLSVIAPDFLYKITEGGESSGNVILFSLILAYFNYFIYYTICEAAFKGYTLGKLISGTKAIREDGEPLTFKDAILRSLSRLVPFEPFSALGGRPWHDKWTNTRVIKAR
ncbi:MAG TPA: RDD family protein [Chitinophagaceae bacterium]